MGLEDKFYDLKTKVWKFMGVLSQVISLEFSEEVKTFISLSNEMEFENCNVLFERIFEIFDEGNNCLDLIKKTILEFKP